MALDLASLFVSVKKSAKYAGELLTTVYKTPNRSEDGLNGRVIIMDLFWAKNNRRLAFEF